MPLTVPIGLRRRLSVGHSRRLGWWAVSWRKPAPTGWEGWDPRWDDDSPGSGVREPRRPPPSPLRGAVELLEP